MTTSREAPEFDLPAPDRHNILALYGEVELLIDDLAKALGCPYEDLPRQVAWLYNTVAGGHQKLKDGFVLTELMRILARAIMKKSRWPEGTLPLRGDVRTHLAGQGGTWKGIGVVVDNMFETMDDPETQHHVHWIFTGPRKVTVDEDKTTPEKIYNDLSPDAQQHAWVVKQFAGENPLAYEHDLAMVRLVGKTDGKLEIVDTKYYADQKDLIQHVLIKLPNGKLIYVVNFQPHGKADRPNTTSMVADWFALYRDDENLEPEERTHLIKPGQSLSMLMTRLSQRAASAALMQIRELDRTMDFWAIIPAIVEHELDEFIIRFINEIINTASKALQAMINRMRRATGLKPRDTKWLRERLNELYAKQSQPDHQGSTNVFMVTVLAP